MTCKDCTERHPGCHGTCEVYAEFYQKNEERKKKLRKWRNDVSEYALFRERRRRTGQR